MLAPQIANLCAVGDTAGQLYDVSGVLVLGESGMSKVETPSWSPWRASWGYPSRDFNTFNVVSEACHSRCLVYAGPMWCLRHAEESLLLF